MLGDWRSRKGNKVPTNTLTAPSVTDFVTMPTGEIQLMLLFNGFGYVAGVYEGEGQIFYWLLEGDSVVP